MESETIQINGEYPKIHKSRANIKPNKKMNKLITFSFAACAALASLSSSAQTFGVKAGLNLSNMVVKDDDETYSDDFKLKPGIHIGGTAEFEINDMVSFEPGALISMKGYRTKEEEGDAKYVGSYNLTYLEIPLNAKATFDLGSIKAFGFAGPYIAVGLAGKAKSKVTIDGDTEKDSESVEWGSDDDKTKRLDFGLNIGAGAQLTDEMSLSLSYGLGLGNLSNNTDNGAKVKNRVIALSFGYKFN